MQQPAHQLDVLLGMMGSIERLARAALPESVTVAEAGQLGAEARDCLA